MKYWLQFFLYYFAWVQANPFTTVKSDKVFYTDHYLQLEGSVYVKGSKEAATADQAEISLDKTEGVLKGNVEIQFYDGSKLNCQLARFENDSGKVYCTVFAEDDAVRFFHVDGFRMASREMVASFESIQPPSRKIATVLLEGSVHLIKDGHWQVTADKAFYNHLDKTISVASQEGVEDSCVFFSDHQGKIYAKRAEIDVKSNSCELDQDVKMINREGPLEQYAVADKVLISKETREARFFSNKTGRVLFYDKVNRLQMSAPELLIRNDPGRERNEVKGYGNVRFHFKDEEYDRLRQYFLLDGKLQGAGGSEK